MKMVIANKDLYKYMEDAINLLCNTVGATLGPSGNNVIINSDNASPFITNDGVTIANNIESDDKIVNTILEITKEASLKTNEVVGDGTTTTLVLLQSIFNEGIRSIKSGADSIQLKRALDTVVEKLIIKLDNMKQKPTKKQLTAIAKTSANDNEMGNLVSEVFLKMQSKYGIRIEESTDATTYYEIKKGYNLEYDNISNLYFQKQNEIVLENAYILLLYGYLEDLEKIAEIINECIQNNKSIIIITEDYNEAINQQILLYYLKYNKNVFLFKSSFYGYQKESVATDISILTNANIVDISYGHARHNDLGLASNVIINKNEVLIISDLNNKTWLNKLKKEFCSITSDYDKELLAERIAKLESGMATIYVGALTNAEKRDKIMRLEDALFAINIAKDGIVAGAGVPFLEISNSINVNSDAERIIKNALEVPFKKIIDNSAQDYDKIYKYICQNNYKKVYNYQTNNFENIHSTNILDPVEVIKTALKNAVSIAGMLLTTNSLVINESIRTDQIEIDKL